jgi:ubiquinone biosynthesis protein UbiJ|tara:strand:+ start:6375 stop:6917 length:543 start_codon:yes stop_codon:yes gene_type:complete
LRDIVLAQLLPLTTILQCLDGYKESNLYKNHQNDIVKIIVTDIDYNVMIIVSDPALTVCNTGAESLTITGQLKDFVDYGHSKNIQIAGNADFAQSLQHFLDECTFSPNTFLVNLFGDQIGTQLHHIIHILTNQLKAKLKFIRHSNIHANERLRIKDVDSVLVEIDRLLERANKLHQQRKQ